MSNELFCVCAQLSFPRIDICLVVVKVIDDLLSAFPGLMFSGCHVQSPFEDVYFISSI